MCPDALHLSYLLGEAYFGPSRALEACTPAVLKAEVWPLCICEQACKYFFFFSHTWEFQNSPKFGEGKDSMEESLSCMHKAESIH